MSTMDKINKIAESKDAIKAAIEAKGVSNVGDKLADYPAKIASIPLGEVGKVDPNSGGTGEIFNSYEHNNATGNYSHAEGTNTAALGTGSHAEGGYTEALGTGSHAEGGYTEALGTYSHAEGWETHAEKTGSHAEGQSTKASGQNSHAEGQSTKASGQNSHAEGIGTTASGTNSHAEGQNTKAENTATHAEGIGTTASGTNSHAEGQNTKAENTATHAEGIGTTASGDNSSHAEGYQCIASGNYGSHAEGINTIAQGNNSHAEGDNTKAIGNSSHSEGVNTEATGLYSHSANEGTAANNYAQTSIGRFNEIGASKPNSYDNTKPAFLIGNGQNNESRGNAFKVLFNGQTFADGEYSSAGADYAEFFEWKDGNVNNEDRVGRFVTLDGDKIRFTTITDTYILGIISAAPAIIGDNPIRWWGKYLNDEWGRPIYEDVEVKWFEKEIQEDGTEIDVEKTRIDHVRKLNPDYNPKEKYIPRSERPEWDFVGMMGKLLVKQDGTLVAGSFCKSGNDGVATKSESGYYVMKVINENQALVLFR